MKQVTAYACELCGMLYLHESTAVNCETDCRRKAAHMRKEIDAYHHRLKAAEEKAVSLATADNALTMLVWSREDEAARGRCQDLIDSHIPMPAPQSWYGATAGRMIEAVRFKLRRQRLMGNDPIEPFSADALEAEAVEAAP